MKKELLNNLQMELKRGALIDELIKAELEGLFIFSDEALTRAAKEIKVRTIVRQELEFKKELLQDKKYNDLQRIIKATIEDLQEKEGDEREEYKDYLINFLDIRDNRERHIRAKYSF